MEFFHANRRVWLLACAAATFTLLLAEELLQSDEPLTMGALAFELLDLALLVGCTATSAALVLRVRAQEGESRSMRRDLDLIRADSLRWREEMATPLRELSAGIRRQFETWGLTAAEQEIGFLMLKGLSHKEIARLRATSEATIRQQAGALYRKANLTGRAALSAFFLEDLLDQPTGAAAAPAGTHAGPNQLDEDSLRLGPASAAR